MAQLRFALMSLLFLIAAAVSPAAAQGFAKGPHVRNQLVAETARPAPGSKVTLALVSTPDPGWHAYWRNPGDAGLPAEADWTLPGGVRADAFRYPVPQRLLISGLMNYVFEDTFARLTTLHIPADARGVLPVTLKLDYLVCTDTLCVPEKTELQTSLTIGDGTINQATRARFDGWRRQLPRPLDATARFEVQGEALRLAVPYPAGAPANDPYFYPLTADAIDYAAPQRVARDGDRLVIETRAKGSPAALEGVLAIDGKGLELRATPGSVPPARGGGSGGATWLAALSAFAAAVVGGLILNVMPCVFPILSLKALSLAKANDQDSSPRAEALAYTAGVVLVCLALGGILLGLRAAGTSAGWAFQLQDPRVILVLLLLVSAIAFNLAGLFEITAPAFVNRTAGRSHGSAFATGALAAFVATPCTGPFMATALGATLILPWYTGLAIFAGLGLGIALPFLLLGFVPALRRRLPRPGPWMATLRSILSVPMFLTALALCWVLGKEAGVNGMAIGLGAALLATLGFWWAGRRQARGRTRALLPALPLIALALASVALVGPAPAGPAAVTRNGIEPFSEARLAELRKQGRPVFAYFTADWCLTCKVNEKSVIETAAVERALKDGGVTVLVGDWTNGDPVLGRFIEAHNRAGVPLYLWYAPNAAEPEVLPQLLRQSLLIDLAGRR
ncbi:protein-disulfide reductase DsbD family protein [Sphingomonas sp. RS6]